MDISDAKILKVSTPEYNKVVIEATDGIRYYANLASFAKVYCFPRTKEEWEKVTPDSDGWALVWASGFDVHMHQVIDHAFKKERITKPAA